MNINREKLVIPVCMLAVFVFWISGSAGTTIVPNLTEQCYRCLCHVATTCDISNGCTGGYCGPFNISRVYWVEAGKIVMPGELDHGYSWKECAREYHCAKRIVEGYLQIFGRDCNGDGVTNCYDYMMVNVNGGYGCTAPLNRSVIGRKWLKRYEECQL